MSDAYTAWLSTLPSDIAAMAQAYPMTRCYRMRVKPGHYLIGGYHLTDRGVRVNLEAHTNHQAVAGLIIDFDPTELVPCDCLTEAPHADRD